MPSNEGHIQWTGHPDATVTYLGQVLQIKKEGEPGDMPGALRIRRSGSAIAGLHLPGAGWDPIPGTSPVLEARNETYFPPGLIRIRVADHFVNVTPGVNMTQGTKAAATRIEGNEPAVRLRGTLTATGTVGAGSVIGNVTAPHRPLVVASTHVRWTGGSQRLQVLINGDLVFGAALASTDNVWLDGVTYDLEP